MSVSVGYRVIMLNLVWVMLYTGVTVCYDWTLKRLYW
jgi:hypothetical protein